MAKLHRGVPRFPHHLAAITEGNGRETEVPAPSADASPRANPGEVACDARAQRRADTLGLLSGLRNGARTIRTRHEARETSTRGASSWPLSTLRCSATRASIRVIVLILLSAIAPALHVRAQEPEIAEAGDARLVRLEALLADLRAEDESERVAAYAAITTLEPDMLPAIRARVAHVRRRRPDAAHAFEVWNRVRRAAGSTRADDETDIAPGVLPVLGEERSDRVMQIVEPIVLWRALERMASFESCRAMFPLLGLDGGLFRFEERRIVTRLGNDMMAAAIVARGHADRPVREWGAATMRRLGADDPGLAVQELDHRQLADVLRAYAMLRMQSAMRVIVSYLDSERRSVRRAARWALEQYGGNAIWILRTEYRNQTGERAPEQWGWQRTVRALYAHVDARRLEPVRRAREAGLTARERGDLRAMQEHLDDMLARTPDVEDPAPVAEAYGALADSHRDAQRFDAAASRYRRALRLAPDHAQAARWRGALALLEAERSAAAGVIDEARYREVLAVDPADEGARRALALLTGGRASATESGALRRWALLAALILGLFGGALLVFGGRRARAGGDVDALESTLDAAPTFDQADATLADPSTSPG